MVDETNRAQTGLEVAYTSSPHIKARVYFFRKLVFSSGLYKTGSRDSSGWIHGGAKRLLSS
jgi:hypothetical protein